MYFQWTCFKCKQFVLHILISLSLFGITISSATAQKVLLISLDGFGQEYLSRFQLPNLMKLYHAGSHPITFMNQYPTKTLPNHFSIATGLYTESHGVVANSLYDPQLDKILNISDSQLFQQKTDVQPIWIANEKHGGVSACLMWAGCGLTYQDTNESISLSYSPTYSFRALLDVSLDLLTPVDKRGNRVARGTGNHNGSHETDEEEDVTSNAIKDLLVYSSDDARNRAANLVMLYFHQPDRIGHLFGAESPELEAILYKLDDDLGYLVERLSEPTFLNQVDLLLLSDHGMIDVPLGNVITLRELIDPNLFTYTGNSPQLHIYPAHGKSIAVFSKLKEVAKSHNFSVLVKEELPERLHYKNNDRIAEFLLQANPGFVFDDYVSHFSMLSATRGERPIGAHGYNPETCHAMLPILVAVGPSFRRNWRVSTASNVDVYPLVCSLLSIPPPPNNGSLDALALMLNSPPMLARLAAYLIGFVCVVVALATLALACYCRGRKSSFYHKRPRTDPQSLISGTAYRPMHFNSLRSAGTSSNNERPSAIMLSEDELEEEQKLLAQADEWEV